MSDFNSLVQYTVENISRPVKYIIYKMTEFIRVVDKFVFRQVPSGAASGYATIEKIEGNTVKFNQLISDDYNNWASTLISDLSVTGDEVSFSTTNAYGYIGKQINTQINHKYLFQVDAKLTTLQGTVFLTIYHGSTQIGYIGNATTNYKTLKIIVTATASYLQLRIAGGSVVISCSARYPQAIDLTAIFGAGNEPSTVADFEAWMAQNIGTLPYYDYNAGELLSVKISGMQTEDSSQQTVDTIALDVTTITGINTATNVREVIFPHGMKQADRAGTVKDTLDLLSDTATVNVGSRAYQSGDESDPDVLTDGTTTYYALTTPIEYTNLQDGNGNPLNPRYKVEQGGTEQVLPSNTSTPTTVAPTLTTTYTKDVH